MSNKLRPRQYADAKGVIVEGFDGNAIEAEGPTVPADGTAGYAPGATFYKRAGTVGAQQYVNEGSATSSAFKAIPSVAAGSLAALAVAGVAAGYKIARGQQTTVAAADTVVTGLATVVAVVASFEDDVDGVTISQVTAQVGNQAGAPAAGSIVIKTWKATSNANPTLIAATTFSKKVNWIAVGT